MSSLPLMQGSCSKREHDGTTLYNTYYQWVAIYLVVQVWTTLYNTYYQWVAIYIVVQV